jgi:hypothetical protein
VLAVHAQQPSEEFQSFAANPSRCPAACAQPQGQVQKLRDERETVAREVAVLRVDLDATRADRCVDCTVLVRRDNKRQNQPYRMGLDNAHSF